MSPVECADERCAVQGCDLPVVATVEVDGPDGRGDVPVCERHLDAFLRVDP